MKKNKILIYNSYTDTKEEFKPIKKDEVSIYYCGPTVYNYVHLGNFRPVIVFDNLHRLLLELGYKVKIVSNYTDIDDKIIKEALKEKKSEKELSSFYIKSYEECANKLNILPLSAHPKASEYINDMINMIEKLVKNNNAYTKGSDTYFKVNSIENYGLLSNQKLENLEAGSRIDIDSDKENPLDFVLWKYTADNGIKFDSPLGKGRPGWHNECVVMVNKVFNQKIIDIHGGGFDLKFPHHENEIAQSLAINKTTLANYWMHVGFLLTDGEKMSKSLGNSILAKDVIENYSPNAIRLFFASKNYRNPINYSHEIIFHFENNVKRYLISIKKATCILDINNVKNNDINMDEYNNAINYLCDDLNTSNVITILDKILKDINLSLKEKNYKLLSINLNTFKKISYLIGLKFDIPILTKEDKKLYQEFNEAYNNKDFEKSDRFRKILIDKGIL